MRSALSCSLTILALLMLSGCQPATEPTEDAKPALDIDEVFNEIFERELALSPIRQSYLGRKTDQQGQWDDFADARRFERVERAQADVERLRTEFDYDTLSEQQQLSVDLFEFNARRDAANLEFHRNAYVIDQFNGQLSGLLTVLQNVHPIETVQDAEDYISRIEGLETVLNQFTAKLRDRAEYGVIAPAFSFPAVIADARSMSEGAPIDDAADENALFSDFRSTIDELELAPADREPSLTKTNLP